MAKRIEGLLSVRVEIFVAEDMSGEIFEVARIRNHQFHKGAAFILRSTRPPGPGWIMLNDESDKATCLVPASPDAALAWRG